MSQQDYYSVLGVSRSAGIDEIKKTYKKLALQHHPDTASNEHERQQKEKKFQRISEAYAVLSDDKKRKQYDAFGSSGFQAKYSQQDIFSGADFSHVSDLNLDDILSAMFGGADTRFHRRQRPVKGQDVNYPLEITFLEAYHGTKKEISYTIPGQGSHELKVTIPAGMKSGSKLKIAGKGGALMGSMYGDLYITVTYEDHPQFTRRGDDLVTSKDISLSESLLGAQIEVNTLAGKKTVTLKPPVKHGTKCRLKGLGFPRVTPKGSKGDLYVELQVKTPDKLSKRQLDIVQQLKNVGL
ncbi:MAG: J domain-containing protein [Proteobacteria bacterium]|nr:J domain-containing protein [Pseudomonadota bacterium]